MSISETHAQTALDTLRMELGTVATDIHLNGRIDDYHSHEPISTARVTISNEKNEIRVMPADDNGGWINLIPCDYLYRVEFTAPGYATKYVMIDARDIPIKAQLGGFSMDIDITLFKAIDHVDYEVLEDPVGISQYDTDTDNIDWNSKAVARTQDDLKKMMKQYDKAFKAAAKKKS